MNKAIKDNLIYAGLILIVLLTCLTILVKFSQPVSIDLQNYKPLEAIEGDVKDFVILAQRFAAYHQYNKTEYNCQNYSQDLKAIADQLGFKTKLVKGCNDKEEPCHVWLRLEVDYEPQEGVFVDYSLQYPYQKVIE